ncbi:hypothetical protein H6G00_16280 [Leptolyngbya sp. FACHB-541]|uniref:hypothetical protein n=1 Tax=Leptolyngbya sp. FACHB-541 TaxID=2692810 RepID=UPI001683FD2A|nr:hypothetical protein [Leptolyngbya sp. FACHB-541]MBD1998164.1 hypothetical protein [Leptolyngbya sp. FACHB-541]
MTDSTARPKLLQPLDRTALVLMLVLGLAIALLILKGDRTAPHVRDFSWQNAHVGAEDTAFLFTFSRPMDRTSVEENLRLEPPLPGKFSWSGRRMAYTLEKPAPYGTQFEVRLQGARDRFDNSDDERTAIEPFLGKFQTRDRAFVYLGVEGEQEGRLVMYNLTHQQEQVLTPENLVVMDFEPYPDGDRILFSATDRTAQQQGSLDQRIYTVTTGIQVRSPDSLGGQDPASTSIEPQSAGVIQQLLDSQDYQNLKFDLSPDGQTVIVQRVSRENPGADFGLWILQPDAEPRPLETEPGGDFLIAPDSSSVAIAQGQGMAILPLDDQADPLDFLPQFGMVMSFSRDGTAAAMVRFNVEPQNPTRSLFLVTNQGTEEEIFRTDGSILSAEFDPAKRFLYCLMTELLPTEAYLEQPYLIAVDLETKQRTNLLLLPIQRDIQMSLAPDGLGILFDQVIAETEEGVEPGVLRSQEGKAIASSKLWFLPVVLAADGTPAPVEAQPLPLAGLRPHWLP